MDKKSSFKNKILDRYFEVVEDEVITESSITSPVDNMEQSEVRVETASVTDEVSVVKHQQLFLLKQFFKVMLMVVTI